MNLSDVQYTVTSTSSLSFGSFLSKEDLSFYTDGKTFKNYTTADGLVNNSVFSILEDKDGNLWFGTRWVGLSRFDGKSFTTFSQYEDNK